MVTVVPLGTATDGEVKVGILLVFNEHIWPFIPFAPDGKKNSKVRIRVENFQLLGGNTGGGGSNSGANSSYSHQEVPMESYDPGYASDINEDDSVF